MSRTRELLGTGVLNWNKGERITDRYGTVILFADPQDGPAIPLASTCVGEHGNLVAVVKEARQSYHVGDLHHEITPTTPAIGEEIVLGEGTLFIEKDEYDGADMIGLQPEDGRAEWWLDVKALYRAHHQTVDLYFQPA